MRGGRRVLPVPSGPLSAAIVRHTTRLIAGFFYWLGPAFEIDCLLIRELFLSGFGEDGHGIAVGKEAIVEGYGFFIGCEYCLPTG